jgi:hypothetical protein
VLPTPWLIALALVVGLIVLIPARRLQIAGFSPRTIGLFALGLWLLAMVVAIRPAGSRFLVPFLLVLYLAPFVAGPERLRRVATRGSARSGAVRPGNDGKPPMKNVTPPDANAGPDASDRPTDDDRAHP